MQRFIVAAALACAAPSVLVAQNEAALKDFFEGRQVVLRIEMPAHERGVDLHPAAARPLDHPDYAERLKRYGTAIRPGDRVMVTKIRVKSKLIEFQLGGGGFGTFGDPTGTDVGAPLTEKSKRERDLEKQVKDERDTRRKRKLQAELDGLRHEREQEDARLEAMTAGAEEIRKENVRQLALQGGSRFNLRYDDRVPADALTPESVMAALARYVEFPDDGFGGGEQDEVVLVAADAAEPAPATALRKGMLDHDVERLFGAAESSDERREGRLTVTKRVYERPDGRVEAEFVEGVLIRFTIASR